MSFRKLPTNTAQLLDAIVESDNPAQYLSERFDSATPKEDMELRSLIHELREGGFISLKWADNKPYYVVVNNAGKTYNEQLANYEASLAANRQLVSIINDHSITIGNGNKLKNTTIASKIEKGFDESNNPKSFAEKHPFLLNVLAGLLTGFIFLFAFWEKIVTWIEGWF